MFITKLLCHIGSFKVVLKHTCQFIHDVTKSLCVFQEKEQLRLMASTSVEGKQLYNQWIIQDTRNIIHILEDMPSCRPEIDHLCELLPRLQCRYYSISSSAKVFQTKILVSAFSSFHSPFLKLLVVSITLL